MRFRSIGVSLAVAVLAGSCGGSRSDVTVTQAEALPLPDRGAVDDTAPPSTIERDGIPLEPVDTQFDLDDLADFDIPEIAPVEFEMDPAVIELPEGFNDPLRLNEDVSTAVVASYGYSLEFGIDGVDEAGAAESDSIVVSGIVDRVEGVAQWSVSAEALASFDDQFTPIHPDAENLVWVQRSDSDRQSAFGLAPDESSAGPPRWWDVEEDTSESGDVFMIERTLTVTELWAAANTEPTLTVRLADDLWRSEATFDPGRTLSYYDGSVLDLMGGTDGSVAITAEHEIDGRIHSLRIEGGFTDETMTGAGKSGRVSVAIDFEYPGDIGAIAVPDDVRQLPGHTTEPNIALEPPVPVNPYSERPTIEMKIIGAWQRDDELLVSVDETGEVTMVTDRSVYSSVHDFNSMRLTEQGHERLAERLDATGIFNLVARLPSDSGRVGPDEAYASMTVNGSPMFRINDYRRPPRTDDVDVNDRLRNAAEDAVDVFVDLSWLETGDIAEPLAPWIPDSMFVSARIGVAARSGLPQPADVPDWPYSLSIEEMSSNVGSNAYDERTLDMCVRGADVEPLFVMLTGVNHAYLRVAQDDEIWELNVTPTIPGSPGSSC